MRFHVAGVEHELLVELITLADAYDVLFFRLDTEPLIVCVVDDVDLVGSDIDEPEDDSAGEPDERSVDADLN